MAADHLRRRFRLDREQIGYVKFVLEAYEGLAQMTSLAGRSEIEWIIPRGLEQPAEELALALREEVGMVEITVRKP